MSQDEGLSLSAAREASRRAFEAVLADGSEATLREKAQAARELRLLAREQAGEVIETPMHHLTRSQLEALAAQIAKERKLSP